MIYLDNAATNGFRSYSVIDTAINTLKYLTANAGRSSHRLAVKASEIIFNTRRTLLEAFNAENVNKVIFTDGCTTSLNTAILGTVKKGGNVVTTCFEHNSVLRPLFELERQGLISVTVVYPDSIIPLASKIVQSIREDTYLIAVTGASNVTGETVDIDYIGNNKRDDILLLVDGAQLSGHKKIDMQKSKIDMLCLAGHKALGGIIGTGVLILSDRAEVQPIKYGGTGTETFSLTQPLDYPEKLEAGSLDLPAIASLCEAVTSMSANVDKDGELLKTRTDFLIEKLTYINGIAVYSKPNPCGIVAFASKKFDSQTFSTKLSDDFDIAVRGGFHCAPLVHKYLKTDKEGLVRVSLSPHNSINEINALLFAVKSIQSK